MLLYIYSIGVQLMFGGIQPADITNATIGSVHSYCRVECHCQLSVNVNDQLNTLN